MLMSLLYAQADADPDRTALVYRDERVDARRAGRAGRAPRRAASPAEGIGPGDAVALLLPNDPWFVASFYAISALGAVVVPVNPAFKQDELEFYFRAVRRPRGDQRRAQRRRLRAHRGRLGTRPPR